MATQSVDLTLGLHMQATVDFDTKVELEDVVEQIGLKLAAIDFSVGDIEFKVLMVDSPIHMHSVVNG